jgi:hypothetical protein
MKAKLPACVLLLTALALTGCVKFKQVWNINPDGSGKMTMSFGVSEQMLQMSGGEDPFADATDPAKLAEREADGWAAFTEPQVKTANGFKTVTVTGYFEDINQVSFNGDGGNEEMRPTNYVLDGNTLAIQNPLLGQFLQSMAEDPSMADPQMKMMMAPMLQGMELTERYELTGPVTSAEGYNREGSTASYTVTGQDLLGDELPTIDGMDDNRLSITFEPGGWDGGEQAWNEELQQAKEDWAAIKAGEGAAVGAGAQ